MGNAETRNFSYAKQIAQRFVAARLNALALSDFPGPKPSDLDSAYEIQDEAIALWPDVVTGWKIGKIPDPIQAKFGSHRLGGPIFRRNVYTVADDQELSVGVFVGGTACFEAEYIFEVGHDASPDKQTYTLADADALAGRLFVGVEMAGSPLADINALGPHIVVSDFGNNADEIVGVEIPNWRQHAWTEFSVESFIDDQKVGEGGPLNIPGGPLESLQFIAENCARRGKPLQKGMLISTGAATGVHDIVSGQRARAEFKGIQTVRLATKPRPVVMR
jgi:2-keto-4-pentenoate hydratase